MIERYESIVKYESIVTHACPLSSHHDILHQVEDHPYFQYFCTHQTPSNMSTHGGSGIHDNHLQCRKPCPPYVLLCCLPHHTGTLSRPTLKLGHSASSSHYEKRICFELHKSKAPLKVITGWTSSYVLLVMAPSKLSS